MSFSCSRCPRTFHSSNAAHQHMNDKNHFEFECHVCDDTWPTWEGRQDHETDYHGRFFCNDCHREFNTSNGLKMHSQSHTHIGRNFNCLFCPRKFATATGWTHHVERGACPGAQHMDRDNLYRFVRSKDPTGYISKKLLEWHGSDQYEATEKAWNGYAYGCYLCTREFNSLHGLNQHLKSPTHQQALYHCPKSDCRKNFKTLASLVNHCESETCGLIQFNQVQKGITGLVSGDRLLTY